MGSNLLAIYAALAAVQVPLNGKVVPVRNVDALPESVAAGDTPVRLLMPWSERGGGANTSVLALQGLATADWVLVDLLLIRPAQAGKLETASEAIVRYMQDYASALARTRQLAGAVIAGPVRITSGVGAYPAGSAAQWFGVEATITVRETWR